MQQERKMPAIPNAEEAERIMPIIREAFAAKGVALEALGIHPQGGVMAKARPDAAAKESLTMRLFAKGIVMAETQQGAFGFAVMR